MSSLSRKFSSFACHRPRCANCTPNANWAANWKRTATAKASTSSSGAQSQFPYPSHRNPTPHEIFHLPRSATEADIKARYFDLVRLYHPDKAGVGALPDVAHARFQAITAAYDALRGKGDMASPGVEESNPSIDLRYQTTATWRAMHRKRSQELYRSGAADEKWKDMVLLFGFIATIAFVLTHTLTTRRDALAEAFSKSRQMNASSRERPREVEDARLALPESAGSKPNASS